VGPVTRHEIAEMFSEVESKDLRVAEVRMNSEALRAMKKTFLKDHGKKLGRTLWKARLRGSHDEVQAHVTLVSSDGAEFVMCRVHEKEGRLCPECSAREVMES